MRCFLVRWQGRGSWARWRGHGVALSHVLMPWKESSCFLFFSQEILLLLVVLLRFAHPQFGCGVFILSDDDVIPRSQRPFTSSMGIKLPLPRPRIPLSRLAMCNKGFGYISVWHLISGRDFRFSGVWKDSNFLRILVSSSENGPETAKTEAFVLLAIFDSPPNIRIHLSVYDPPYKEPFTLLSCNFTNIAKFL